MNTRHFSMSWWIIIVLSKFGSASKFHPLHFQLHEISLWGHLIRCFSQASLSLEASLSFSSHSLSSLTVINSPSLRSFNFVSIVSQMVAGPGSHNQLFLPNCTYVQLKFHLHHFCVPFLICFTFIFVGQFFLSSTDFIKMSCVYIIGKYRRNMTTCFSVCMSRLCAWMLERSGVISHWSW